MRIEVTQCSMCKHYSEEQYCEIWQQYITNDAFYCACGVTADRKTEPTISKMEQVEDEPMKTTDYCDICKRDMCEVCVADATNPYCVPSHYEINYEPKTETQTEEPPMDEYYKDHDEFYEPQERSSE